MLRSLEDVIVSDLGLGMRLLNHNLKTLAGAGVAAPGACTLTGAAVGNLVLAICGALTAGGPLVALQPGIDFEATISVANQIQQLSATDYHLYTFWALLQQS